MIRFVSRLLTSLTVLGRLCRVCQRVWVTPVSHPELFVFLVLGVDLWICVCLPHSSTWASSIFKHIFMINWIWCLQYVPSSWLASLNVHGAFHLLKSTNMLGQLHDVDKSFHPHVFFWVYFCYIIIFFGNPCWKIWTAPAIGRSGSVNHRPGHLREGTAAEPRGNGRGLEVLRPGRIRAPISNHEYNTWDMRSFSCKLPGRSKRCSGFSGFGRACRSRI